MLEEKDANNRENPALKFSIPFLHTLRMPTTTTNVGWSDFHLFAIFENGHIAVDWLYFL